MNLARIYDLFAPLYDLLICVPIFGLRKEQSAALPHVAGKRILEIGCGTGYLLERLASPAGSVVGLDISQGMLREARKRLSREDKKVHLIQGSYYDIPFEKESFDCVLATFALTHAPDLLPVLGEIARVLEPGGRLVIVDVGPPIKPSSGSRLMTRMWRILGDYPRDESPYLDSAGFKVAYRRELSKLGTVHLLVAEKQSPSG